MIVCVKDKKETGTIAYLSCSAELELHQGDWAAVSCSPSAGCSLEIHSPGKAPEAGLPAAMSHQTFLNSNSLGLPETRECSGLFSAQATTTLFLGLSCEEGLQLGMVHVCCGDGLRDAEKRTMKFNKPGALMSCNHIATAVSCGDFYEKASSLL